MPTLVSPTAAEGLRLRYGVLRSIAEFERSELWAGRHSRYAIELALAAQFAARQALPGYCRLCGAETSFAFRPVALESMPNWREELACSSCGLINRVRSGFGLLSDLIGGDTAARVYVTEQASRAYVWLKRRFPGAIGSEFCVDSGKIGRMIAYLAGLLGGERGSIRHEDVRALSMEPGSLDAIACFEVLEHVFEYRAALAEFARVLRPGGVLVVTVPFVATAPASILRATIDAGGSVRHLLEPEYHGDPISGEGVLCFHHFGWDLLDAVRAAGFKDVGLVDCWAPQLGFMGFTGLFVAHT
jgi:SAM-dependent methyltransferase